MFEYQLQVTTGNRLYAGSYDYVFLTLIGKEGESERMELKSLLGFTTDTTKHFTIQTASSLGELLLITVEKEPFLVLPEDEWYCSTIRVKTEAGGVFVFPCYKWICRGEKVELRGGKALKVFEEDNDQLMEHRKKELKLRRSLYQWKVMAEGLPHIASFEDFSHFPAEVRLSATKSIELKQTKFMTSMELKLKGIIGSKESWENIDDTANIYWTKQTPMSDYTIAHWKEDEFYGMQFLNGVNPMIMKRCSEIPPNFPVTEQMVEPFLEKGTTLRQEMKKGNIFLYDQKKMDGICGRDYEGELLAVTPCLGLFYMNPEKKLKPIAIQLQQKPSKQNPIFLPSDEETDWLLAKMFLKNSDFMAHESTHHLLFTHLLAEVFIISTFRNLPEIHPLFKLLVSHFQDTLILNMAARKDLLGPGGALVMCALGFDGLMEFMRRNMSEVTYDDLCLPENIRSRGMDSVPNYYYRDDGLKVWGAIHSFVKAVVNHYYPTDREVCADTELQDWIKDIFTHGFLGNKASGIPERFSSPQEVSRFLTMVIFNITAQHAAVNNGQFDYCFFIPNCPALLRKPPPTTKGQSDMKRILETLPNRGETAKAVMALWVLSQRYSTFVPLGQYPERFSEPKVKQIIGRFQAELSDISESITARNSGLDRPYTYLDPAQIENSIAT